MSENNIANYLERVSVQQYKADIGFRTLVESVNDNMYIIPKYQRKYRWNKKQVVALVESLLKGFPIPPIYACRNAHNQLEILDGQQRVMSLFFYYIGYFLNKKEQNAINFSDLEIGELSFADALKKQFKLEELHIDLKEGDGEVINIDYASLPVEIKRKVDYRMITVIEIKVSQEGEKEKILQTIFANLNANGSLLSEQERRNGMFMCGFYNMLQEFNRKNIKWRKIWGKEDQKEKDVETLLRFCALRKYVSVKKELPGFSLAPKGPFEFDIQGYYSSYGEMLDFFSEAAISFRDADILQYRDSLEKFVDLFEINIVLNAKTALMEGFYVVYEKLGIQKKITREMLDAVQKTSGYKDNSGQRTVDIKKMRARWNAVYEIWDAAIK